MPRLQKPIQLYSIYTVRKPRAEQQELRLVTIKSKSYTAKAKVQNKFFEEIIVDFQRSWTSRLEWPTLPISSAGKLGRFSSYIFTLCWTDWILTSTRIRHKDVCFSKTLKHDFRLHTNFRSVNWLMTMQTLTEGSRNTRNANFRVLFNTCFHRFVFFSQLLKYHFRDSVSFRSLPAYHIGFLHNTNLRNITGSKYTCRYISVTCSKNIVR